MARVSERNSKRRNVKKPVSSVPHRRRTMVLRLLAAGALIASLVAGLAWWHYARFTSELVVDEGEVKTLVIPHDTPWDEVVQTLVDQGITSHPHCFDLWGRQNDLPRHVKAGTYRLEGPITLELLNETLCEGGKTDGVTVTIPEGFTIFHVADRLERLGLANKKDFLRAARSKELLQEYDVPGESFEGYLFPDTYRITQGSSAEDIVVRFHKRFIEVVDQIIAEYPEELERLEEKRDLGFHEVIILASLIERETNYNPERAIIARVFLNRIDRDIRLQTDPTCVYNELTYLEIPHPKYCKDKLNRYSTYIIDGLPPGPISNPGKKSIEAALMPATSKAARTYIFFVAKRDGSGSHHFTATYKQHKAAIRKFLK